MNRLKWLFQPDIAAQRLRQEERTKGIWRGTILLFLASIILTAISAYLGIGNESLSKFIHELGPYEFGTAKALFAIGQVIQATIVTAILLFIPALFFWVFTDVEYKKLHKVQLLAVSIYLIQQAVSIPFQSTGLDADSLPFSLGVIAQYITKFEIVIHLLAQITLFSIWSMFIQYKYIKMISEKNPRLILAIVISINVIIWLFTALFSYIQFEKVL